MPVPVRISIRPSEIVIPPVEPLPSIRTELPARFELIITSTLAESISIVLDDAIVPPPDKPFPAIIETLE